MNIFDRFLCNFGHWNLRCEQVCLLAVASILIGAKVEQSTEPCINNLLRLLTEQEKNNVSRKAVIKMERVVLKWLGFDVQFSSPLAPIERYLCLLGR